MDVRMQSLQKHFEWKGKSKLYHVYLSTAGKICLGHIPLVLQNLAWKPKKINKSFELTRRRI